ncbi:MAG: branched-chain amino acid transaminase [Helicobacter sp.]|uniref:branched-chain amino acid transaminase n=1 Tax=Helicobacter sp. 10-6591 TaxID=2004998 RepID=UPI000DCE87FA|nr:branched-chain amino acid transaminase [Helicobacter sp. 10-6591]MDD7568120.1 branched-chain amino acid transaminase [Helicobacter sp.]MDY5741318.1 branched-chain amino acid transaminase [Helicobacter sp.]RAX56209.1 branched chain amino acid aminotransferase [Helicobacter sp. 10-6591]
MKEAEFIWKDGEFVKWHDATTHILSHTLHYGNAVFEGTRAYMTKDGLAIFRLQDHTKRLLNSAKIVAIKSPYTQEQLESAQIELLRKNKDGYKGNVYIRPLIYLGYGVMGLYHINAPVNIAIAAWEWGAYLGDEGITQGIKVKTSSFARNSVKSIMGKAKAAANYLNSQMAKLEALQSNCEEALLLDENGFVAEGSGECIFIVRDGVLITPPHDNTLESITQATTIELAKDLKIPFIQRKITRDEIYIADEAFFTGTAAEITPIRQLDFRDIGNGTRGAITKKLQEAFFEVVQGKHEKYKKYLTFI